MSQTNINKITLKICKADASLQASAGELILMRGDEGSGKTSWLKCIAGLSKPAIGITLKAQGDARMLFDQQPPIWLGQNVGEELCFGLKVRPVRETLDVWLNQWGLAELDLSTELKSLNRLQSIRLSIAAMALAEPKLILIDAQTDTLSSEAAAQLAHELAVWTKNRQVTVVVASNRWHDWQSVATQTWQISSTEDLPQQGIINT